MGLDGIELIMAVEERFNISIPDEQVEHLKTPRDLIAFVTDHLNARNTSECISQRAFHLLRRSGMKALNVGRSQFMPQSKLEDFFPKEDRQRLWKEFGIGSGIQWPALIRSKRLLTTIVVTASVPFLFALNIGFWKALLLSGISATVFFLITQPLATSIPARFTTVADLVHFLVSRNPNLASTGNWTPEQIRTSVRDIISEHLAISPDFSDDARFIEDLHVDQ